MSAEPLMQALLGSKVKIELAGFFRNNPGVMETVGGLAIRLGMTPTELKPAIADHVQLGVLKELQATPEPILRFDVKRLEAIEKEVVKQVEQAK